MIDEYIEYGILIKQILGAVNRGKDFSIIWDGKSMELKLGDVTLSVCMKVDRGTLHSLLD